MDILKIIPSEDCPLGEIYFVEFDKSKISKWWEDELLPETYTEIFIDAGKLYNLKPDERT